MWRAGRAGTTRPRWPEGSLASRPRDGFNSQLDGDESAKRILGGVGHISPQRRDPDRAVTPSQHVLSARGSGSQGFCGTDWEWRLLI